jgi:hypothetical protein
MGRSGVLRWVAKEIGRGAAKLAVRRGARRILGKLLTSPKEWAKAMPHIAEHFSEKALRAGKKVHGVFLKKYRSREGIEELARRTAQAPSRKTVVSRATNLDGIPAGTPVVILEREFSEAIGYEVRAGSEGKLPCRIFRIVADLTGRPIAALPTARFLDGLGVAIVATAFVSAVENAYSDELAARDEWYENPCSDSVLEWMLPLILTSSCTHDGPPSEVIMRRAASLIRRVERELNAPLDPKTRVHLRDDVEAIWRERWPDYPR